MKTRFDEVSPWLLIAALYQGGQIKDVDAFIDYLFAADMADVILGDARDVIDHEQLTTMVKELIGDK